MFSPDINMALSGVQQVIIKYRNRTPDELNQCLINLCRLLSSFSTVDKQTESIVAGLRELYLMLQMSSRVDRRVPENVTALFLSALQDLKAIHPQMLAIIVASLAGICPSEAIKIDVKALETVDINRIPVFLHLLRQQDIPSDFGHGESAHLVKYLNDAVAGPSTKKGVLAFFGSLLRSEDERLLYEDCYDVLCWSMANWLVNASTFDEFQHEKSKRTTKSLALLSVTEMDGSTPSEAFTLLSLARAYAEDQQMNVLSFMLLYDVLASWPLRNLMERSPDGALGMPLATLRGRVKADSLDDVAFEYCLRLLKQSEVRPVKSSYDCELQDVVLSEAVRILDLLCARSPKLVRGAFRSVVDVNDRAMRRIHSQQVLLHTFRFLLYHGDAANFEMDNMCHFICCDFFPSSGLLDSIFASEFLWLLLDNRRVVQNRTKLFTRYFPCILKILAWNPRANMHLLAELLPFMVAPISALEVFHLLVDLPCVSIALEVTTFGETSFLTVIRQLASERTKDTRLKFFFDFYLRNEGGRGVSLDQVSDAHRAFADVASHPRTVYCAQAVSALICNYFSAVADLKMEKDSNAKLAAAALDRMHSLFGSYADILMIQTVMADGFILLVSRQPGILIEIHDRIADYIMKNHFMYTSFLTSLVWCIGEHIDGQLGVAHPKAVAKLYDALEFLTYDIIKTQSKTLVSSPHEWSMDLFQTSLTAMTRVGALSRDLTRRTVICLNNVIKKTREHPDQQRLHVIEQIDSLIRLLELPSVSEIVMNLSTSPEPEVLEAVRRLKSVAEEYNELSAAQTP